MKRRNVFFQDNFCSVQDDRSTGRQTHAPTERSKDGESSTGGAAVGTSDGIGANDGIAIATRVDRSEPSDERRSQYRAMKNDDTGIENRRSDISQVERVSSFTENSDKSVVVDDRQTDETPAMVHRDISRSTEQLLDRISQLDDNRHPEVQDGAVETRRSVTPSAAGGDTPLANEAAAAAGNGRGGASVNEATSDEVKLRTDEQPMTTSDESRERDSYDGGLLTSVADHQQLAAITHSHETEGVSSELRPIGYVNDQKPPLNIGASGKKADDIVLDSPAPQRTVNDVIEDYEALNKDTLNKDSYRHRDGDHIAHGSEPAAAVGSHASDKSSAMSQSQGATHSVASDDLQTADTGRDHRHTATDTDVPEVDGARPVAAADVFDSTRSNDKVASNNNDDDDEESTLSDSAGSNEEPRVAATANRKLPSGTDYIETATEPSPIVATDTVRIESINIASDRNEVDLPSALATELSDERSASSKDRHR